MKLTVKLTAEQTADLPFPIGCPVWYNFPEKPSIEPPLLKRGVVESVAFNMGEKDLIYEVVYKDGNILEEVSEHKLAYGAHCPVTVDCNDGEGLAVEGTVLLCKPATSDPSKILYTIMIMMEGYARYEEGIDAKRVKYRKVNTARKSAVIVENDKSSADANVQKVEMVEPSETKNIDPTSKANRSATDVELQHDKETVPSSITCDSIDKRSNQSSVEKEVSSSKKRAHRPDNIVSPLTANSRRKNAKVDPAHTHGHAHYRQDSHRSLSSYGPSINSSRGRNNHETWIEMKIPEWLQRSRTLQRNLFFHLVGSKHHDRWKRTVNDIERETHCGIQVIFETRSPSHGDIPAPPMSIKIVARNPSSAPAHRLIDVDDAREKVQELLLDYMNLTCDEGAKGRLIYDVASSCTGDHRPRESTSHAVRVRDPSGAAHFVSAFDLPVENREGTRSFHGQFILQKSVLGKVKGITSCVVKVCGRQFGVPLNDCNPHVLVTGRHWQDVDQAVDILKDVISGHMANCSCAL